jgi:hypothetical protein
VHAPARGHASGVKASGRATGTGTGTGTADSSVLTGTPEERAEEEAALMLNAFAPPPGAREVSRSPVPSGPISDTSGAPRPTDSDVVTKTSWWVAPGDPKSLVDWEAANISPLYHLSSYGTVGSGIWDDVFGIPVNGLFDELELAVSTTSTGHGQTAIRVDALVDYYPARPAGDTVPATATAATLVETKDGTPPKGGATVIARVTVTDLAEVRAIAAYLNGLPVTPPGGMYSCLGPIGGIAVTFSASPGGPAIGKASAGLGGCEFLSYTMPGHPATGLGSGLAGENLLDELNHVTGLHWKIPPMTAP